MGIIFDVLYDRILLAEVSNFSKFFTSSKPIQKIHGELKVAHDTQLVLSPTNNRHELWNTLRSGKAIFASINKPKSIEHAKTNLLNQVKNLPQVTGRGRSRNEITSIIQRLISSISKKPVTSLEYKQIKRRIMGPMPTGKRSIIDLVDEIYPEITSLKDAIDEFIAAIKPGNYILVKRVPLGLGVAWATPYTKPTERRFPVRDERDKNDKVFGQEYVAWTFDGDRLVDKQRIAINAIKVYNQLFSGWGDRDFYIVDDASLLQTKRHPFVSSEDFSFVEILPLEYNSVKSFASSSLQKYQKILTNKVQNMANQLKIHMYSNIDRIDTSDSDIKKSIDEYRDALGLLNHGIQQLDFESLFRQFLKKDARLDLSTQYMIINAGYPFEPYNPYSTMRNAKQSREDWEVLSRQYSLSAIEYFIKNGFNTKIDQSVKIRSKENRTDVRSVDMSSFAKRSDANKFEMFDANHNRWVPFDAKYIDEFKISNASIAIAFKNFKDYNDFVRRFVLFVIRTIVKPPEVKNIANLLGDF